MKLLEIKNNLAKISYETEEALALASFIALVDKNKSYVAQIVNLKADIKSNYAVAKLVFTFSNDGIVDNYDGTIPSIDAELSFLSAKDILALLPIERSIALGDLAQQNIMLRVDQTLFEKNLVICAEKFEHINTIIKNTTSQLEQVNEKCVVIDTDHNFSEFEPFRFKRDFKLPLNSQMIDFIYENDLSEVDATSKAIIQDIFYEVQEYTKTVADNFIPFDSFVNVVSQQYEATQIPELALLKNKLLKYREANIFAQTKEDIISLKDAIEKHAITYVDISEESDELQKELIGYIHKTIESFGNYIYLFVKLTNKTGDKKLLKQLVENEHVFSNIVCSHSYKYLAELKQRAENLIIFSPQTVQHDFASYNTFLTKLNANEFITYGALTQNVPFIVELSEFDDDNTEPETPVQEAEPTTVFTTEPEDFEADIETQQEEIPSFEAEVQPENIFASSSFQATSIFEEPQEINPIIEEDDEEEIIEDDGIFQQPEMTEHDKMVEQIARDVDEIFYSNIVEEIPSIDDLAIPQEEVLTEDDLDFIAELPQASYPNNEIAMVDPQDEYNFQENLTDTQTFIEETQEDEQPFIIQEAETEEVSDTLEENNDFQFEQNVVSEESEQDEFNFEESDDEYQEPEIPVYPAETPILTNDSVVFEQGDMVSHPKYGRGVIEKLIKYGNKTLCSISFEDVGRRLLDPAISELQKV